MSLNCDNMWDLYMNGDYNNNEIDNIIETLEEISELIRVDIFDMNWKNDEKEDEDKQDFALYSIWRSIDVLKKERKQNEVF